MSFDVALWYRAKPMGRAEALSFYKSLCEGDTSDIEPNPAVATFVREVTAKYPQIDDVPEEQLDECPWNIAFDQSEGHVIICIAWSRCDEIVPWVTGLAAKHGLTYFDPQSGEVYLPRHMLRPRHRWWQFWR